MEVRRAADTLQYFAGMYLNAMLLNVNDVKTETLLKIDKRTEQLSASDPSNDINVI